MRINIPRSTDHPITCLTVKLRDETYRMTFDDSHTSAEIELPEGVSEDQVEIVAEFHDARNIRDERLETIIVKEAKKSDAKDEGKEVKTEVTNGPQIALTEPPKPKGRQGRQNDKPADKPTETPAVAADKPAEASTETTPADKPAESSTETATEKPVEKS